MMSLLIPSAIYLSMGVSLKHWD